MITVKRKAHFNAAHRLYNPKWSDQKNREIFGKCANPEYHGHNYDFFISVTGTIDPETGFVINLDRLKSIIESEIDEHMDHKNLNTQVSEFKNLNPTAENIAVVIWNRVWKQLQKINPEFKLEVELYETARNVVIYKGSNSI